MSTTTRTPDTPCPSCGASLTAATSLDGEGGPEPGAISLCCYCGAPLVFNHDMSMRMATRVDLDELPVEQLEQVLAAQRLVLTRRMLTTLFGRVPGEPPSA